MSTQLAIEADGVRKHFPGRGAALDGLDLQVQPGVVHGVLGPNGAGKTTAVRILSTLQRLDAGRARVAGHDVGSSPAQVRARIGVAGQYAAVDEILTGRQNLEMFARLNHLRPRAARNRSRELLTRFDLAAAADRPAGQYSGGMRRRLDLAVSLIRSPQVLFLDEPTTGLDPRSRIQVWEAVRELSSTGTTVLLTTQYLEEADRLCARITLLAAGRVAAEGTPTELKERIGTSRIEVAVPVGLDTYTIAGYLSAALDAPPEIDLDLDRVCVPVRGGAHALTQVARAMESAGLPMSAVSLRQPDLDEVFLQLTAPEGVSE
ncbi:MAG: ATP-binding cassette domain-containing protein [Beutenbergiaceae bacterium]